MIGHISVHKERRQQGRFAGFSMYVSSDGARDNTSFCYKDGPKLPALNFTTTCFMSGRYVIFYNERLNDVDYPDGYIAYPVYTELCEVTVHGKIIHKSFLYLSCCAIGNYLSIEMSNSGKWAEWIKYILDLPHIVCLFLIIL